MSGRKEKRVGYFRRLKQWIHSQWTQEIQEIPEEIAICEFDCRKWECREGIFETCKRRFRTASKIHLPQTAEEMERQERQEWQQKIAEALSELKELRAKLELLQERVDDLKADRDH